MINNTKDDGSFAIKQIKTTSGYSARISATDHRKLYARKADLGMGYGKSVHGILSAAVPAALYKQIVITAREEKMNISDLIRRGVMREIGAIRLSRSLNLDPAVYGATSTQFPAPKPVRKSKAEKKAKVEARKAKAEAQGAIRELRKVLKKLAKG